MGFSRAKIYEDDKTWAWKFVLRLLAILFNVIGIVLRAWALAKSGANYGDEGYEYYGDDFAFIPWNLIPVSFCRQSRCYDMKLIFVASIVLTLLYMVSHERLHSPFSILPNTSRRERWLRPLPLARLHCHRVLLGHWSHCLSQPMVFSQRRDL